MRYKAHSFEELQDDTSPDQENREGLRYVRELARLRYGLRRFLRFSEEAARSCGVTPQQHQLMLGVAGYTDHACATISELAEFLQEKHHSVVGLVERAVQSGLVRRTQDSTDRRVVIVSLTQQGEAVLSKLSKLHQHEVTQIPGVWKLMQSESTTPGLGEGAAFASGAKSQIAKED